VSSRFLLVAVVLGTCLLGTEAVLRHFDLPRFDACETVADYAVGDPQLGFRGDPSRPVLGVTPNALGLRGPLPAFPKPDDELRLLFLGDSTCWGLGVALEDTFGVRATKLVDAFVEDRHATFLLGAFPSYSSYHSAILLERLLPQSPDVVILYLGARNDGDRARYYADAQIPARRARLSAFWHQSHTLRALEAVVDRSYRHLFRRLQPAAQQTRVTPDEFRANLHGIVAQLRAARVPVLLVLPPISPAFEAEQPQVTIYRDVLVASARELGLPSVSLDERFEASRGEALFFDDHFHLAARGHAIAAEEIVAAMLREGLLSAR
jgi:lysophospholipase L1-like esterase